MSEHLLTCSLTHPLQVLHTAASDCKNHSLTASFTHSNKYADLAGTSPTAAQPVSSNLTICSGSTRHVQLAMVIP